jgi:hypothetical protein
MPDTPAPLGDIVEEARRLRSAADEQNIPLRLIGGVAVHLHTEHPNPLLQRPYKDIDLVAMKGTSRKVNQFMEEMGYERDAVFNATNGHRRLLYYDVGNQRQVDVFVGSFEMCHQIPITDRIARDHLTVPLAELLLTKMQVVELNEKDQRDIVALLADHDVGPSDDNTINSDFIARLLAGDWGLWRTTKLNVERIRQAIPQYDIGADAQATVRDRIDRLWQRIEAEPKSGKWKMRDRIGDRKRWYEQPEEVG